MAFVDALVSQVGSSLATGAIIPGDEVDLSSWMVRNHLLDKVFDSGLRLRICTYIRTRLDCSRVHSVFGARDVVPHLSSRIEGDVLALPSIPDGVTVLHVTAICDDSMVVTSVNKGRDSVPLPLLIGWSPSEVV